MKPSIDRLSRAVIWFPLLEMVQPWSVFLNAKGNVGAHRAYRITCDRRDCGSQCSPPFSPHKSFFHSIA